MRRTMNWRACNDLRRLSVISLVGGLLFIGSWQFKAHAELLEIQRDNYCKSDIAYCGTITFENGGGYVVTDTQLRGSAVSDTPRILSADAAECARIDVHHKGAITLGNAVSFIVPATCSFTLKLKLALAPDLSEDLTLTPGCKVTMRSYGTAFAPKAKVESVEGTIQDLKDNQCGA